ncbi:MAG TPA: hypothetical protein ENI51_03670 [Candidatus Atribacteria bacterium]|nr:hypothetical protein [Candidatus Atribacteria bacterium]
MDKHFLVCPFCEQKISLVLFPPNTKPPLITCCKHLILFKINEQVIYCDSEIAKYLEEEALPIKFLSNYLEVMESTLNNIKRLKLVPPSSGSLEDLILEAPYHAYSVRDKDTFIHDLKNYVKEMSVKEVKVNLKDLYSYFFLFEKCSEALEKGKSELWGIEVRPLFIGSLLNIDLKKLPNRFFEKIKRENLEEIKEWLGKEPENIEELENFMSNKQMHIGQNAFQIIETMRELDLKVEDYTIGWPFSLFNETLDLYNFLEDRGELFKIEGKLKDIGWPQKRIEEILDCFHERIMGKVAIYPKEYFGRLRDLLESYVDYELKQLNKKARNFSEKLKVLCQNGVISKNDDRLLYTVWEICSKYLHPTNNERGNIMRKFRQCCNILKEQLN